jgi:uncharacterized membrane protein YgaE (UPF0421/DUF939 family)
VGWDDDPVDVPAWSDLSWERGRLSLRARFNRLHSRAWMVGQCSIAAAVAWVIAYHGFGHDQPFFAPIAAVICLGTSYGQRLRRVAEVTVGVMVGIGVADIFVTTFGRGEWQIAVVVAVAMSAGILLDAGVLLVNQAAVQSIVVVTLLPVAGGPARIVDALIGGVVALVAATIVPGAPLRRPREEAAKVTAELARLIRQARNSATVMEVAHAQETLDRARETELLLSDLRAAAAEGLEVVRSSPFRRGAAPQVRSIAEIVGPMDRAIRNTRVLIRRIVVSARLDETMPPDYLDLLDRLAHATDRIATELAANRSPEAAQPLLAELAEASSVASAPLTLSAAVVLAQIRSIIVDLLELSGLSAHQAVAYVPERR